MTKGYKIMFLKFALLKHETQKILWRSKKSVYINISNRLKNIYLEKDGTFSVHTRYITSLPKKDEIVLPFVLFRNK